MLHCYIGDWNKWKPNFWLFVYTFDNFSINKEPNPPPVPELNEFTTKNPPKLFHFYIIFLIESRGFLIN